MGGSWVAAVLGVAAHPRHNRAVGASTPLLPPRRDSCAAWLVFCDGSGRAVTRILCDEWVEEALRID